MGWSPSWSREDVEWSEQAGPQEVRGPGMDWDMIVCPNCGANLKFDPKSQKMLWLL